MARFPSGRSDFQMAGLQFQLLPDAGSIHFSKCSAQLPLPAPPETLLKPRRLDCAAPISSLGPKFRCDAPGSVHALASVPDLRRARGRKNSGAADLSRDT